MAVNVIRRMFSPYKKGRLFRHLVGGWLVQYPITAIARRANVDCLAAMNDTFLSRLTVHAWENIVRGNGIDAATPVVIFEFPPIGDEPLWFGMLGGIKTPVFVYSMRVSGTEVPDVTPFTDVQMRVYDHAKHGRGTAEEMECENLDRFVAAKTITELENRGLLTKQGDRWLANPLPNYNNGID